MKIKCPFPIAKDGINGIVPLEISNFLCLYKLHVLANANALAPIIYVFISLLPLGSLFLPHTIQIPYIFLKPLLPLEARFHCAWFCFLTFLHKTPLKIYCHFNFVPIFGNLLISHIGSSCVCVGYVESFLVWIYHRNLHRQGTTT